jgi:DNA excision repair protein ERCC-8
MIVACQWYPHDSGMFVTASSDKTLKIWDTNRMKQIESFSFECAPRHQHWSPISDRSGNSLIAVATGTTNIELIDLR